jgi:tRNA pseudouridine65 synthase
MSLRPLFPNSRAPLPLLYRDDVLVIVNKPSGLAAHRGYSSEHGDYVLTRVRDQLAQHVYLVHRLDRATSGAVALALHAEHVAPLQRAFELGQVEKQYLALVRGRLEHEQLVDYAIPKGEAKDAPRVLAQTQLRPLAVFEERYTLVEARPLTGRYHQIRRHLKHLRHPIVGDTTYGDGKQNRAARERFGLLRLFLHASKLVLPHPVTSQPIAVVAPLPEELTRTLSALGYTAEGKLAP